MPTKLFVDKNQELIYTKVWGNYTSLDAHTVKAELSSVLNHRPYKQLHNLTFIDRYYATINSVHTHAEIYRSDWQVRTDSPRRVAFVAPSEIVRDAVRVYESINEDAGQEIRLFSDLRQACEWLEVNIGSIPTDDVQRDLAQVS